MAASRYVRSTELLPYVETAFDVAVRFTRGSDRAEDLVARAIKSTMESPLPCGQTAKTWLLFQLRETFKGGHQESLHPGAKNGKTHSALQSVGAGSSGSSQE